MKLSLQKLFIFSTLVCTYSLVVTATNNEQQQKPFHNHNSLDVKTILEQHDKPDTFKAHQKNFEGETLAYVTPWNNRGKPCAIA